MYHHSLHILLCGTDTLLESSLRRATPHPGFTHVITAACGPFCSPAPAALPGLAEADLYARRDLMPTSDVRDWAAQTLRGLYGLDRAVLENTIFPGLQMGADSGLLL